MAIHQALKKAILAGKKSTGIAVMVSTDHTEAGPLVELLNNHGISPKNVSTIGGDDWMIECELPGLKS